MKYILLLISGLLLSFIIDWSFLSSSITAYEVHCGKDYLNCKNAYTITYRPNVQEQQVISKSAMGATVYKKCHVYDRKNWRCEDDKGFAEFGFSKGDYFYIDLREQKNKPNQSYEYIPISRWGYILNEIKYWIGY